MSWILTNPLRRLATNRAQIIADAGITSDTVVLEVGAGNGFFTEFLAPLARKLYVVELQDQMVRKLYRRLRHVQSRSMLEIRIGDISRVDLPPATCGVAFVYYSFHELADQEAGAAAIVRALGPEGRIYLVEPRVEVSESAFRRSVAMFEQHGFSQTRQWLTLFSRGALLTRDTARESRDVRPGV